MARCSFCGKNIEKGTGTMFVRKSAKILHFCTMKCRKNLTQLNRKPRDFKWATPEKGE